MLDINVGSEYSFYVAHMDVQKAAPENHPRHAIANAESMDLLPPVSNWSINSRTSRFFRSPDDSANGWRVMYYSYGSPGGWVDFKELEDDTAQAWVTDGIRLVPKGGGPGWEILTAEYMFSLVKDLSYEHMVDRYGRNFVSVESPRK
jgi:hypothetical protein